MSFALIKSTTHAPDLIFNINLLLFNTTSLHFHLLITAIHYLNLTAAIINQSCIAFTTIIMLAIR